MFLHKIDGLVQQRRKGWIENSILAHFCKDLSFLSSTLFCCFNTLRFLLTLFFRFIACQIQHKSGVIAQICLFCFSLVLYCRLLPELTGSQQLPVLPNLQLTSQSTRGHIHLTAILNTGILVFSHKCMCTTSWFLNRVAMKLWQFPVLGVFLFRARSVLRRELTRRQELT